MNAIGRPALGIVALTLSSLIVVSCASATPTESPSASASPAASVELPSASPSPSPSVPSAPSATPAPTAKPGPLTVTWHRSADAAAPRDSWWALSGGGGNKTWTKLGDLYVMPNDTDGYEGVPLGGPQIWLSTDLLHWHLAKVAQPANQRLTVKAVTLGGPGLVALGEDVPDDAPIEMWWTSTDGETWTTVADDHAAGLTPGQAWLLRATAQGNVSYDGGAVDVTAYHGPAMDPSTAQRVIDEAGDLTAFTDSSLTNNVVEVWQATGSAAWRKVGALPKSTGGTVLHAVHGAHGYFLFGCGVDCNASLGWTSADGVTWRSGPVATFDEVNGVIGDASGFIAVGQRVTGTGCVATESEIYGETWTSSDGITWRKMKDDPQFNHASASVLITRGRTLFGVGVHWVSEHAVATVWTATLPANSVASGSGSTPTPAPTGPIGCGD